MEIGYDFAPVLPAGEGISWATRTTDGYVAVSHSTANDTATIWYSTAFTTGWSAVVSMRATQVLAVSRPVTSRLTGKTVLMVGEYGSGGTVRRLRGSFDGGATWSVIRTGVVVDAGVNAHWHTADYDVENSRIWASHGDGPNGWFGYSDDHGATWTEHRFAASDPLYINDGKHQPTVVACLPHRIAIAPDGGFFDTGVWQANKPGTEFDAVHSSLPGVYTYDQYGSGPYAWDGADECYIAYGPSGSGSDRLVIAATGDGGRSWHNVYEQPLSGGSHTGGIVGPDAGGRLAWNSYIGGTWTLHVAPALDWNPA